MLRLERLVLLLELSVGPMLMFGHDVMDKKDQMAMQHNRQGLAKRNSSFFF